MLHKLILLVPILVPKSVIALIFLLSHEGNKHFGAVLSNYRLLSVQADVSENSLF